MTLSFHRAETSLWAKSYLYVVPPSNARVFLLCQQDCEKNYSAECHEIWWRGRTRAKDVEVLL